MSTVKVVSSCLGAIFGCSSQLGTSGGNYVDLVMV